MWARGSAHNGVYILPALGGTPRRIAPGLYVACWSPDGSKIVVGSYLDGRLWLLDLTGRRLGSFALEGVHWSIWDIDWSPVTDRLVVVSNDYQGRYTIWVVRPDGTDQRRVLSEDREIFSVRWAPDGDAVYYLRRVNHRRPSQGPRARP